MITRRLLDGATSTLAARGVADDDVDIAWVPGAFEVPLASKVMAEERALRRGDRASAASSGVTPRTSSTSPDPPPRGSCSAQLETEVPIVFGVLTVENRRQALVRSVVDGDVVGGNNGAEAADTALEMIAVLQALRAAG